MRRADIIVIGAGMIGASAALALAEAGVATMLVGPGEPADKATGCGPFASHYDEGRITRIVDPDPLWAGWAAESIARYADIEAASGIRFHHPVGSIRAAPAGSSAHNRVRASAAAFGAAVEEIDGRELAARCPAFVLAEGFEVLWEAAPAGHINPRPQGRGAEGGRTSCRSAPDRDGGHGGLIRPERRRGGAGERRAARL